MTYQISQATLAKGRSPKQDSLKGRFPSCYFMNINTIKLFCWNKTSQEVLPSCRGLLKILQHDKIKEALQFCYLKTLEGNLNSPISIFT